MEMDCVYCYKKISPAASVCPWCHNETETSRQRFRKTFLISLAIVLALFIIATCNSQ